MNLSKKVDLVWYMMGVTKMSEKSIKVKLDELINTTYAKEKISNMSKKFDVPIGVAESMFRSTLRQMLDDKNTDWSKFKVVESS